MEKRLDYIDALRGFAILGVMSTHAASIVHLQGSLMETIGLGGYGVQLFFVISAFTIFLTYERSMVREQFPVRNFFIRRLFRIIPVYWFGIGLYLAVYGLQSRGWLPGPEPWHIPMNIFLVNLLHPATQSSAVPGGWSISCEVLFYLTVPLWFLVVRSTRAAWVFTLVTVLLGPQLVKLLSEQITPLFGQYPQGEIGMYWYRSLPNQLGCFAIGILLYRGLAENPRWVARFGSVPWNLLLLAIALALMAVAATFSVPLLRPHHLMAFAFASIGLALSQIPWKALVNRATVFLGRISYSAYLLHFLVLKQLTLHVPQDGLSGLAYFLLIWLLNLLITVPLAWVSYQVIEKTFVTIARRWITRLETPTPAAATAG